MEGYRKDTTEYYRAVYQVSDGTFSELSKGITRNSDYTTRIHNLSNSGSIAYIEVYEGEHAIVCLDTGKLLSLEDGIIGMCDNIQFNNRQVGLYDGEKLLVFDTEKEKPIVEINHLEIASFTLTDEYLYYLGIDSTLCRISLEDGSKKSVLLKKINKYADISLNVWDEYTKDHWFFDDDVIRVFISSSLSRDNIALEIDKDSLEMIGQDDTVLLYNEDSHCYYKTVGTSNPRSSQSKMKLAMIPCYSLDELIEKGKQLINNKELSEHKKMRYGIN